jgi:galactose mutarotase-like enzyme
VELVAQKVVEGVPKFREVFTLSKGVLRVEILVEDSPNVTLPFAFGYHPYLQIDKEDLKDLKLTTDISIQFQL